MGADSRSSAQTISMYLTHVDAAAGSIRAPATCNGLFALRTSIRVHVNGWYRSQLPVCCRLTLILETADS